MKNLNYFFDKIYVISLQNTENRFFLKQYLKKHDIINYKIVEGIDGHINYDMIKSYQDYVSLPIQHEKSHIIDKKYGSKKILSPGAIGLLSTYKKIFIDAIDNKYNYILILEEDILISNSLHKSFQSFIKTYKDFTLLFFGASQYAWNNIVINNEKYIANNYTHGSFAIGYNCKILYQIIECINNNNCSIDSGCLANDIIINNPNTCHVLYPNKIIADTTKISNISLGARNLRTHKENVKWDLSDIDFVNSNIWKVSILMANYNSSTKIQTVLNSIKNQLYKNLEIVIVDDNSTDNSKDLIKEFIDNNKDINIKLIELEENIGAYGCRCIAFKYSSGFFITILDSDDVLLPNKISSDIYNYFIKPEYELFFSKIYRANTLVDQTDLNISEIQCIVDKERRMYSGLEEEKIPWEYRYRFGIQTIFTDRLFFNTYGLWKQNYRYGMDINLVQRYIHKKYGIFVHYNDLWRSIYCNNATQYGIHLSNNLGLVSYKMNISNATILCSKEETDSIHADCAKEFM